MFTKTFSLSPFTTFDNILRSTCILYGLIIEEFTIYQLDDDTDQLIDLGKENTRVLTYLEAFAQTSKQI